jgi:sterol desaturase/sphingolipid hydroxylase (fatty acid hydroxylase superfamily)
MPPAFASQPQAPSRLQPATATSAKTPFVPLWAQATYLACSAVALVVPFYIASALEIDDVILPSVPFFMLLMVVEATLLRAINHPSKAAQYTFDNVWENFSMGLSHLLLPYLLARWFNWLPYWLHPSYIHENHAFIQFDASNPWVFALGFLTCDLEFYFFHSLCHTMATLWPAHAMHHNSDTFNLSVSVRQSVAQV